MNYTSMQIMKTIDELLSYQKMIESFTRNKTMVQTKQLKITAEVDGKQVPLETVSTETFEAIKALEKPKKIPVARLAKFNGWPRLIFRPTKNMQLKVGRVYALALDYGNISADWTLEDDDSWIEQYKDIKPL